MADLHGRVLIVDREADVGSGMATVLESRGIASVVLNDGEKAVGAARSSHFDVALVDPNMPVLGGMDLIRALSNSSPRTLIAVTSGFATVKAAVEAMRAGAFDYLPKPVRSEELILLVQRAFERIGETGVVDEANDADSTGFAGIIGQSPAMRAVFETIGKVASSRATVVIEGESGTGKELVARAIHQKSKRRAFPFVSVHCSAIPTELLEGELFGHEKGAFTGAIRQQKGKFELADRGTILFDEIGTLDSRAQVDLLRVLQEREFMRIGGSEYIRTDARVIAATNESLRKLVEVGRIREDFYYRLNVVKIQLPPLRERREDIPLLANHLIEKHSHREGLTPPVLASDALEVLSRAPLPGNVRELENALERAIVMGNGREIRAEDLGTELLASECVTRVAADDDDLCLESHVRALEAELIVLALKASGQNRTSAAKRLGITDRTLRYKVQKYNIQVPPHGRTEPVVEGDMR